jgi:hypothetical protein
VVKNGKPKYHTVGTGPKLNRNNRGKR